MDEVAAAVGLPRPWPEDFAGATLAGFVLDRLGRIPVIGQSFGAHGATFEVVDMDGKTIDKIVATRQIPVSEL